MDRPAGQAQAAIFAANGSARHRLVRAGVVAGAALLAAWLVALALGVLGGFGSLPVLPSSHPRSSSQASSHTSASEPSAVVRPHDPVAEIEQPATGSGQGTRRVNTQKHAPKAMSPPIAPSTAGSAASTGHGHGLTKGHGTTRPSGKPLGSPGNGAGGTGAPGQLR